MMLAFGMVAGLFEAQRSGRGQVVDAAILDGTVSLMGMLLGMRALGLWSDERGGNLFDGGAPFYAVYECADGEYVAVGALEEQFYTEFVARLRSGPDDEPPSRNDPANWPALREWIASRLGTRTRDEWAEVFSDTDACVAPVLSVTEAAKHPHVQARGSYLYEGEVLAPAPVPRFDRTPGGAGPLASEVGADTVAVLTDVGYSGEEISALLESGVIATND
jgi:alpha-methylacyl-CoA racemase